MNTIETLKDRNPAAAENAAKMLGAALHMIWDLGEVTLENADTILIAGELLSIFTDRPEEYLDFQSSNEASVAYDSACGWLTAHRIKERYELFEHLILFIVWVEQVILEDILQRLFNDAHKSA